MHSASLSADQHLKARMEGRLSHGSACTEPPTTTTVAARPGVASCSGAPRGGRCGGAGIAGVLAVCRGAAFASVLLTASEAAVRRAVDRPCSSGTLYRLRVRYVGIQQSDIHPKSCPDISGERVSQQQSVTSGGLFVLIWPEPADVLRLVQCRTKSDNEDSVVYFLSPPFLSGPANVSSIRQMAALGQLPYPNPKPSYKLVEHAPCKRSFERNRCSCCPLQAPWYTRLMPHCTGRL